MASGWKRSFPNRIHYHLETDCEKEAEKTALARRIDHVHQLLFPPGGCLFNNGALLNTMCGIVEKEATQVDPQPAESEEPAKRSFMRNSGKNTCMKTDCSTTL